MEKYEARPKYIRDVSSIKGVSHDEGFAKGKEEGRQEGGIQKVAITMHQNGFDVSTIAASTGLSVDAIETILAGDVEAP